jgi:ABC-type multidrug transport system fused ATPase/permease subunit
VLDEATASLDPDADTVIMEFVRRSEDRATLLIAHRPATIAAADRAVALAPATDEEPYPRDHGAN